MKKILILFILSIMIPLINFMPLKAETADELINKGLELDKQNKFEEAIKYYDEALKVEPNNIRALGLKGSCLHFLHKYDEAIKCYDEGIKIDPKDIYCWYNKGHSLSGLKKYDDAIVCFDKALTLCDKNDKFIPYLLECKAYVYYHRGDYKKAEEIIDKALEINPKSVDDLMSKGDVLQAQKKYEEAMTYFDKAAEINPKDSRPWVYKGDLYSKQDKNEEALKCYEKALEIEPDNRCAKERMENMKKYLNK